MDMKSLLVFPHIFPQSNPVAPTYRNNMIPPKNGFMAHQYCDLDNGVQMFEYISRLNAQPIETIHCYSIK